MASRTRLHPAPTLSKLTPPRLGRVFARERLFALLDNGAPAPATWISGPPGAGKTTLVATYLDAADRADSAALTLWLQVDPQDADPAAFAHFLALAVARALPRRRVRLPAATADDLRDAPAFVRRCLGQLCETLPRPWTLVLDNFQQLAAGSAVCAGLASGLPQLPAGARLLFISRELPPSVFVPALAGQQLALLDAAALPFTLAETRALVQLHGQPMPAQALHDSTAGWAAAMILQLAAGGSSALPTGAATQTRLFDYFAGEVLAKLPPADADALSRIAFLPSATASMAETLSGRADAGALLRALAARSLFTDCREGAAPAYSFHALFAEFLRSRAVATLTPLALQALQRLAGSTLADNGQADRAVAQLIEASDFEAAAALLQRHASDFIAQGRTHSVLGWLAALPAPLSNTRALQYWRGVCLLADDPRAALQALHAAATLAGSIDGADDDLAIAAAAADAITSLGEDFSAFEPWMLALATHAPSYLAQRAHQPDIERDLRVLPGLLAAYVHRRTADPLTARLADVAEALLDQAQARSQRILLGSFAMYLLWTGQLSRLDRTLAKIDRLCRGAGSATTAALTRLRWYGISVLIRSLRGDVTAAMADAQAALALAAGHPQRLAKAHLLMVLVALAARDATLARHHLDEATARVTPSSLIDVTTYEFQCAMLALLRSDWPLAYRLMSASQHSAAASGWPLRQNISQLGVAIAATQVGDFDAAELALSQAMAAPFYAVCQFHHWIAALVQADLAAQRGDQAGCLAALRRGFAVARQHGFDYGPLPFCCGQTMSRLCALALTHDVDRPFALGLVRRHALPAPSTAGDLSLLWPWPLRLRCLGRFGIELEGLAPKASRKESRKPLDLLKLLIALGGRNVRADRLAGLLWPDMAGDAAQNSLDNALHRLRKLLGETAQTRCLLMQGGGLSLNPATCWTDVGALQSVLQQASALTAADDAATLRGTAAQALALYGGDFLAGDDSYPELLPLRNRLRAAFRRQLAALGGHLQARGDAESAVSVYSRVIEVDPLAENVVRQLMLCLRQLGRRAEAYEAYRSCRQQLAVLLAIKPAAATEALAATLRDG